MKEFKKDKSTKKKPGEFKKKQKKFQNIQHNRNQLKLLREEKIEKAELFILDPEAFKKVTIVPLPDNFDSGMRVVYLYNRGGHGSKLRTGGLIIKDGFKVEGEPGGHIYPGSIMGLIVHEEVLKKNPHIPG